jgi:hypothetical protein
MTATSHVVWMAHLRTEEVLFCGESLDTEYAKRVLHASCGSLGPRAFPDVVLELREFMPPIGQ